MNRGHYGNVAIYLTRRLWGDTLKVVDEVFGITKNSTVSSSIDRIKHGMRKDKGVNLRVDKLINTQKLIKIQSKSQT
jgi:chromosomal replication initiation ATPase DnaA